MKTFPFGLKSITYLVVLFIDLFAVTCLLNAQHLNHVTTWIGNSWSGEPGYMPCTLDDMFVCPDGTVYLNASHDENRNKHVQLNQNGDYIDGVSPFIGDKQPIHGNEGGFTCAANATYVYFASLASTNFNWDKSRAIVRRNRSDIDDGHIEIDHAEGIQIFGLACTDTRVYAACNDNMVRVYDQNLVSITSWSVTEPAEMCFDADGKLWILNTSGNTIYRYDVDGTKLAQEINLAPGVNALDVAITSDNRLLVANAGVDCNILIYDNLNSAPILSATFGPTGGVFSGIAGKLEGNKFYNPMGVGTDNAGNIYVMSGRWCEGWNFSHSQVWSFTSSGALRWRRGGTIFMDCMDFDRSTDGTTLYSAFYKYKFDYNSYTPNRLPEAITTNYYKYTNELRTTFCNEGGGSNTGTFFRVINSEKFLYLLQDGGRAKGVWIYRFNSSTDGEIAIPCGYIRNDIGKVWYDANANGEAETSEQTTVSYSYNGGVWIDSKGDIWITSDSQISQFPLQQIDGNGVPQYTAASIVPHTVPSTTTLKPRRIRYFPANDPSGYSDVMFLGGESTIEPKDHWKVMGPLLCRYDNWSSSKTKSWEILVPHEHSGTGHESAQPQCFDVAGDYVFVVYVSSVSTLSIVRGEVKVFNTSNGTGIGYMRPTPEMSEIGLQDIVESMRAYKRSTGEYIILIEDNGKTKNVMYRWTPKGDESGLPSVSITASDANASEQGLDAGVFTITRTGGITESQVVNYSLGGTAATGDYTPTLSGTVTIAAESASETITITPVDDSRIEGYETVILTLSSNAAYTIGSPSSATVTIIDNDGLPVITVSATDASAAEEASEPGVFTITRDKATSSLTVNFAISGTATNWTDYTPVSTSVTMASGVASATVTITPTDDSSIEGEETVIITIRANAAYTIGSPSNATISIADNDFDPTMLVWWKYDETSGTTASDATGNGRSGSLLNGLQFKGVTGKFGKALTTDGVDDVVRYDHSPGISAYPFSMSSWVKTSTTSNQTVAFLGVSTTGDKYYTIGINYGKAFAAARNTTGYSATGSTEISNEAWHLIVGVFESETSRRLYVDGVQEAISTDSLSILSGINRFSAGLLDRSSIADKFNGSIDDVRLYGKELSDSVIVDMYNSVLVGDTVAPTIPTNLIVSVITDTSFTLSWTASTDIVGVMGYEVFADGVSKGITDTTSLSITGLTCGTLSMSLKATDAAGNWSDTSTTLTVITSICPDTQAPTAPTILSASSITDTTFTLSWTASTDNVGVTGYEVLANGASKGLTAFTSMSVTGLTSNTAYSMTVKTTDAAGNWSEASAALDVNTSNWLTHQKEQNVSLKSLNVYPNPLLDGNLTINIGFETTIANVVIYDISGKLVYNKTFTGSSAEISVQIFEKGAYIVSVHTDIGSEYKLFIKN